VRELLTRAICWDKVIENLVQRAESSAAATFTLRSFGNSIPLRDLTAALNQAVPDTKVSTHDLVSWILSDKENEAVPRGSAQSKLAIVGMSCRLPGGASVSAHNLSMIS
jgi:monodictyphenone polyketide synthase